MRISDWSSDVCSSDLSGAGLRRIGASAAEEKIRDRAERIHPYLTDILGRRVRRRSDRRHKGRRQANVEQLAARAADRNLAHRRAVDDDAVASAVEQEQRPRFVLILLALDLGAGVDVQQPDARSGSALLVKSGRGV